MFCFKRAWRVLFKTCFAIFFSAIKGLYSNQPGHSCKDIRDSGDSKGDGEYWIDPEKAGHPFKVYCDMTTDGGKLRITLEWYETANFLIPWKECTKLPQLPAEASFLCICPLIADKLRPNIVKVFVDPRGFAERGNERQTEKKKNKWKAMQVKVWENLDIVSQTYSETPRDVETLNVQ